jgi:hypothetical protein
VWLIKMVKTTPAQMAHRQTKNATVEYRSNLLNGASVRALSTTSSATKAYCTFATFAASMANWERGILVVGGEQ